MDVFITRTAAFLPNDPVGNDEMVDYLGEIGDRPSRTRAIVLRQNGIKQRYYVLNREGLPVFTNAQLTTAAIRRLLGSGFAGEDIDLLCCGTSSPDQIQPNHAVMVHGELKNPPCEVMAASGVCASSMSALKYGFLAVKSGESANAVVTGSEVVSTVLHARNFQSPESEDSVVALQKNPQLAFDKEFLRWLLSDGAGCVLLERDVREERALRVDWIDIVSYADQAIPCMVAGGNVRADGSLKGWREYDTLYQAVNEKAFALKQDIRILHQHIVELTLMRPLRRVAAKRRLQAEQVDYFLPHFSSEYFRPKLVEGLARSNFDIPEHKWFTNLASVGNVGSASIFLMLDELFRSGRLRAGQQILCWVPESGRFSSAFMKLTVV